MENQVKQALEVGHGDGAMSLLLVALGYAIEAVDPKSKPLQDVTTHRTTLQKFPLKEGKYDLVVAFNVLHYLKEDLEDMAPRLVAALKPGGVFVSRTPVKLESEHVHYDSGLTSQSLRALFPLEKKYLRAYWMDDAPHAGAEYPHRHYVVDFVGGKTVAR